MTGIIITLLMIIAIGIAIFFLSKKSKKSKEDNTASYKRKYIKSSDYETEAKGTTPPPSVIKSSMSLSPKEKSNKPIFPKSKVDSGSSFDKKKQKEILTKGIKAKITRREPYGLFVKLPSGLYGLLHSSNLHKGRSVADYADQDTIFVEEIPPNQEGKHAFKAVGEAPKTQKQLKEEIIATGKQVMYYPKKDRSKQIATYLSADDKYIVLAGVLCKKITAYGYKYKGKGIALYLNSDSIRLEESPLDAEYIYTKKGLKSEDAYDKHAAEEKEKIEKLNKRLADFKATFDTVKPTPIFSGTVECEYSGRETKDHKPEGRYDAKPTIDVKIYGDIFSVDGDFYIQGAYSGNYSNRNESNRKGFGSIYFQEGKNYASYNLDKPRKTENEEMSVPGEEYLSTSNLAREMGVVPKDLITYFIQNGLLQRIDKVLKLTITGEKYGGKYHFNEKKETWVVWPKSILDKQIITKYRKTIDASTGVDPSRKTPISPTLENKISYFGLYHPYHGGTNPEFDKFSGNILNFKSDKPGMIEYFANQLNNIDFDKTDAIVIVPSHSPKNKNSPVKKLAQELAARNGWIDATDCVVRAYEIPKLSHGGERSMDIHLKSLKILNQQLIANKNILVLDDVTTSGNSLSATMQLLKANHVNSVWSLAIAKTN